jgi:mono/diheme cytochrome c family protein
MNRIALALAGIGTLSVCAFASGHSSGATAAQTTRSKPPTTSTSGATAPIAPVPAHTVARPKTATPAADTAAAVEAQNLLVKQYCSGCHSEKGKAGGVSLVGFDAGKATENVVVAEKMIHKLRAGMMPPPNARRPDEAALTALVDSLETRIDRAAALHPNPGSRSFQRLNRVEYARAVKDLLAIDVDVNAYLPPDTISQGFDNVADSQALSATLLEGYLRAAGKVTALAVGDPDAESAEAHYRVPKTSSQLTRVDGAPIGTRGGISVIHTFPADGDYVYRIDLHGNADGFLFGGPAPGEQLELSINGERKALLDIDPKMAEVTTSLSLRTPPIHIAAGPQRVTAAFIQHFEGPVNDLVAPVDHTLADTQIGVAYGVTTLPHLKDLSIIGPQRVTGVSDTPSRRKIFTCRPTNEREEETCAVQIVKTLSTQAFRRPPTARDIQGLMRFYADGRKEGNFETGISSAIEAMLASPQFVFRVEETRPAALNARAGAPVRISDFELASRLSFFLWGTSPDAELLKAAEQGRLSAPGGVEKEVKRMLADPQASALSTRFAAQWLRLNDVEGMLPDAVLYPYFDHTLGEAFVKETELFFDSIVREDRSVLDLITADYSYVNERIARHYGISNVSGPEFQRVIVPDERRGLFGKGSILVLTSVADRTSPVMRGKWVMEVMLDSPPPPPPPDVPLLEATSASAGGKRLSVRERMEEHRKNPACQSCHRVIDPIGLSLEVFDVTGKLRTKDNEVTVDAAGVMYEGTKVNGPAGLRAAMLKHQDVFLQTFTKNLMVYALGRRVEATDMPTIRAIVKRAAATDNHFSSFVLGIVNSAAFQKRAVEVVETTTASRP